MRFFSTVLALTSAAFVVGQNPTSGSLASLPSGVPLCAISCASLFSTATSDCPNPSSDPACLCNSSSFQSSAASCILNSCGSTSDQQSAYTYAQSLCSKAGVTLPSFSQLTTNASGSGSSTSKTGSVVSGTAAVQSTSGAGQTVGSMGAFIFCMGLGFLWV